MMRLIVAMCALVVCVAGSNAMAITNGSFESGLTGWTTFNTSGGSTTYKTSFSDWTAYDGTKFALAETDGVGNKQGLKQTFALNVGDQLCFEYFFKEGDCLNTDKGGATLDGPGSNDTVKLLELCGDGDATCPKGAWISVSSAPVTVAGNYEAKFWVENGGYEILGARLLDSWLGIDNVRVCVNTPPPNGVIPEPMTMLALLSGVGGLAGYMRRRLAL